MLDDIEIRSLGVIDQARLPLGPGFTAITGETGAGKTMVVTALGLLLGGRATSDAVRADADKAVVEGHAVIDPSGPIAELVAEAGGDAEPFTEDDATRAEVVLARQVAKSGRSRAWLGGRAVPASVLASAGEHLVAVHGQSEQLRLTREEAQRTALDRFGGVEVADALERVAALYDELRERKQELDALCASAGEREAEREGLRKLADAVDAVAPQPGEDKELLGRIERLSNREQLRSDVGGAHELLSGEHPAGSLRDRAREVRTAVDRALRSDSSLESVAEAANDLEYTIDDLAAQLGGYLADLDTDGVGELDSLNDRLAALEDLKRRYDGELDEIAERAADAGRRLLELTGADTRIPQLAETVEALAADLDEAATRLSNLRAAAAQELAEGATGELAALAMPNARLHVDVTPGERIRRTGRDQVQFLLTPHPGAKPSPLAVGASGGELSRVMLALEVVLAAASPVPTLVFDEVDAGVGGAAALEIGARLQRLATTSQVIVVTHLAQVAAFADHHVRIEKATDGQVTTSSIRELDAPGRVEEMTRLLSGLTESETGRAHAEELLRRGAREVG
ncbi:DNA repair protein RecN [Gulosibacter massiliensis]|uniref:DNA repair protein RecN n=1 Tax=Gulosibacter massiliensis TaxID=2479839 RepID=UPI000F637F8A|nr:DNA repair protein RecN [Gulosibacter massiliensis]